MTRPLLAHDGEGHGPVLLLLHAFPFDRRFWKGVTPGFVQAGYRVIAPDLRGFGDSKAASAWSLLDQAHDVADLLASLGVEKAHVLGLSMGGYVALALAAAHRQVLASLVLAHTKAAPDSPQAREGREAAMRTIRTLGASPFLDGMLDKLLAPHASQGLRAHARTLMNQADETLLAALEALRDRPDRRGELPTLAVPTLVLTGAHDGISAPAENQEMAAALPDARLEVLPDAGHLGNLESPDAFVRAVLTFLAGAPA